MKLRIEHIRPRTDLSLYELYKTVKAAINASTLKEAKDFIDKMDKSWCYEAEEEDIPKLKAAFTFKCQTLEERERELEIQRYDEEEDKKRKEARDWFNTLSPELQEHIQYLTLQPARG